jgi:putative FmdB family regulatory protein
MEAECDAMPIYEYVCADCGKEFEVLVRSDTRPACPQCQSSRLNKRLSVFATAGSDSATEAASPCGTCGHPGGPGSCAFSGRPS